MKAFRRCSKALVFGLMVMATALSCSDSTIIEEIGFEDLLITAVEPCPDNTDKCSSTMATAFYDVVNQNCEIDDTKPRKYEYGPDGPVGGPDYSGVYYDGLVQITLELDEEGSQVNINSYKVTYEKREGAVRDLPDWIDDIVLTIKPGETVTVNKFIVLPIEYKNLLFDDYMNNGGTSMKYTVTITLYGENAVGESVRVGRTITITAGNVIYCS